MDDRISRDIYERTEGHAGLTCFCGKQMDEKLMRGKGEISFYDWLNFATCSLIPNLKSSWATMEKLVCTILNDKYKEQREMLVRIFLRTTESQALSKNEQINQAEFLAAEGILIRCKDEELKDGNVNTFKVASHLVRNLVTWAIRSKKTDKKISDEIPTKDERLDIPKLLEIALKSFDRNVMKTAPKITYKKSCNTGIKKGTLVPHEACYHFELYTLLSLWLDSEYIIHAEANTPLLLPENASVNDKRENSRKRCDIYIKEGEEIGYILELVASSSNDDIKKHFDHIQIYQKSLKSKYNWIINFFTASSLDKVDRPQVPTVPDINVIHICHDLEWTWAKLFVNENSPVKIDLSQLENLMNDLSLNKA